MTRNCIQRQGYTLPITRQETQEDQEPISIYKITNTQTGQAYVGQTRNVLRRMQEHLSASGSLLLHDAFLDYGVKNFTFIVIHTDIAYDTALADLIENHFIMKEDTLHPKGYNLRLNDIPKIHSDVVLYRESDLGKLRGSLVSKCRTHLLRLG